MKKSKKPGQMSIKKQAEQYRLAQAEALMRGGDVRVDDSGKILPAASHNGERKRRGKPEAVFYARGTGPRAYRDAQFQLAACRSWAFEHNMGVIDEFMDMGSGTQLQTGLRDLLDLVERHGGAIEVLVTDLDRLGRDLAALSALFGKLRRAGVGIREVGGRTGAGSSARAGS